MQLLTAVNLVLPKLGERPVTSLEVKHPTLAVILPIVDQKLRQTLLRGWWFNDYAYTAPLAVDGTITVGQDTLSFVPDSPNKVALRGTRLFNTETLSYTFTEPVKGRVIQFVEFDELPDSAGMFVFYSALVEIYATDIGMTQELQLWQGNAAQGWSDLMMEHLRQRKHTTRNSRHWRKYISALQG